MPIMYQALYSVMYDNSLSLAQKIIVHTFTYVYINVKFGSGYETNNVQNRGMVHIQYNLIGSLL